MTELEAWLRLWHIPKVGPRTFNFLLSKYPCVQELFCCSSNQLQHNGVPQHIADAIVNNKSTDYKNDLAWLHAHKDNAITRINQARYPALLAQINDPPPILYSVGDLQLFTAPLHLAIVGSRSASSLGQKVAFELARNMAKRGVVIVSGLAYGIDRQAHEGALSVNSNSTIAVLGNGLDIIYPKQHHQLVKQISNNSLMISEFAPGSKPLPQHFPRRNRVISGLCLGTLVIEAASKSGSLITAKYALEQGREIFAVPGPINNPNYTGCHQLIQQGAKLTTNFEDILLEIAPMIEQIYPQIDNHPDTDCLNNHHHLDEGLKHLLNKIDYTPLSIEEIILKSGLTPEQVSSMLTELELGGHIATDTIGQYSRI